MAIASAAYAALDREPGGVDYSALLDETGHAGGDPHARRESGVRPS